MTDKILFRKTLLATAIAVSLASVSPQSFAEDAEDSAEDNENVVLVTGIRGSLLRAADIKRNADGIVDAISIEDIGKFPDTNLAESLQRIAGVSIDRSNGEGSKITVRGLGPQFNTVTLNGRMIASSDTKGDRNFDFATISADMISGLEVYKTSNATLDSAGMGASVNVQTFRPLSIDGEKFITTVKAINDTSTTSGSITPEFGALYSNTFADDTIGVSVAVNYHERENGSKEAKIGNGWYAFKEDADGRHTPASGGTRWLGNRVTPLAGTNAPGVDELFSLPQWSVYNFGEQQHKRVNGQFVLQWAPNDSMTATFDYNTFKKDVSNQSDRASIWYDWQSRTPFAAVWDDGVVQSPLIYAESRVAAGGGETTFLRQEGQTSERLNAFGFNFEWDVSQSLFLELDASSSNSKNSPKGAVGSNSFIEMASLNRRGFAVDFTGEIPAIMVANGTISPEDVVYLTHKFTNEERQSNVNQFKLAGTWTANDDHSIDFGAGISQIDYNLGRYSVDGKRGLMGEADAGAFSADLFSSVDGFMNSFNANYGDFSQAGNLPGGAFLPDGTPITSADMLNQYLSFNLVDMFGVLPGILPAGSFDGQRVGDCGTVFCPGTNYAEDTLEQVEEDTTFFYLQHNWASEVNNMPFYLHLGYRYEETDVLSGSSVQEYNQSVWVNQNNVTLLPSGNQAISERGASYKNSLPSMNFSLNVTDDFIARAGYSKTVSRLGYGALKGGLILNDSASASRGSASSGNPGLKPLEAENFDVSFEWYFGEDNGSYASIAWFKKNIANFTINGDLEVTEDGVYQPGLGALADEARAAGNNDDLSIFNWIIANRQDHPAVQGGSVFGVEGDPLLIFDVRAPVTSDRKNSVDGLELSVQYMLGETGFGGLFNYTFVDTEVGFPPTSREKPQALVGISDSANLVAFYDDGVYNVRFAYNWRDQFLNGTGFGGREPIFTEAYGQLDFNVSYNVSEQLQVFVQGVNLLEEDLRTVGRTSRQLYSHQESGSRWVIGGRYSL